MKIYQTVKDISASCVYKFIISTKHDEGTRVAQDGSSDSIGICPVPEASFHDKLIWEE